MTHYLGDQIQNEIIDLLGTTKKLYLEQRESKYFSIMIENNPITDEHFERVLEEATNVARDLNVETDFPPIDTIRPRRKPTQFQYEQSDEVLHDPKTKYKVEVF
ncbi:hypothetical protein EVAR_92785_1 [Eumeta japonica]|uniref:Uncharacterized protein n=1 Tax=Eumeta variegata TaxID=151549 RepID=A0A4C1SXB1_EUMVA|nr:hypothetical protein EVAR_92785_1 [Eumeta japonica]